MTITGTPSDPGINPYSRSMRSLQSSPGVSDGISQADSVSIAGEQARSQIKPDMVAVLKRQDTPMQGATTQEAPQADSVQGTGARQAAEISSVTIKKEEEHYSIDLTYPQITGGLSEEARRNINGSLESFIKENVKLFEESAKEAEPRENLGSSIEGGFTTMANNDRFISFGAGSSSYVAGCAHPSNELATFNYDAKDGRSLTFNDLFKLEEEEPDRSFLFRDNLKARREREIHALKVVSRYCIEDLKKQNEGRPDDARIDESLIMEVAAPEEGKFNLFNITDNGLVVDFYYCHAAGYGEVKIPYEALADIIDPESVIGQHARIREKKSPDDEQPPELVIGDEMILIDDVKLNIKK